jgi:hypothetical protein
MRDVRLEAHDALNADTRLAFAKELSRSLKRRQEDIQRGATPHRAAATPLADAIKQYFDGAGKLVDKKTATEYRAGPDAWLVDIDGSRIEVRTGAALSGERFCTDKLSSLLLPDFVLDVSAIIG